MRWCLVAGFVMLVATCGQKGPLELPKPTSAAKTVQLPVATA